MDDDQATNTNAFLSFSFMPNHTTYSHTHRDRQTSTAVLLDAFHIKGMVASQAAGAKPFGRPLIARIAAAAHLLVRHIPAFPRVFSSFHHGHPSHLYTSTGTGQRKGGVVAARVVMPSSSSLSKKQLPVLAAAAAVVIVGAAAALYLSKKKEKAEKSRYV